jgi:hypothetical protein
MNKKFIMISIGIFISVFIFTLGFKFILGDKVLFGQGNDEAFNSSNPIVKYVGFEEDENILKIKISIKNNSNYIASVNNVTMRFGILPNAVNDSTVSSRSNPIFEGYDNDFEKIANDQNIKINNFDRAIYPEEEREYAFEVTKGIHFDKKVFDTNKMYVSYNINYYKYKIKGTFIGNVMGTGGGERLDNSSNQYVID